MFHGHYFNELFGGYPGQILHYFNELFGGYRGQMLHYFNDLFGGHLGPLCTKWNCKAVVRSGRVCLYDTAACTLHDCFILKREDTVRFVVIYKKGYGGSSGLKWGCPAVRNQVSRSLAATIWRSNMAK